MNIRQSHFVQSCENMTSHFVKSGNYIKDPFCDIWDYAMEPFCGEFGSFGDSFLEKFVESWENNI